MLPVLALAAAAAGTACALAAGAPCFGFPAFWRRRQVAAQAGTGLAESPAKQGQDTGSGRVIRVVTERAQDVVLSGATVEWMDRLMKEEAVDVLAAGAEYSEKAPEAEGAGLWYAFMKPQNMGPWKNQVRLKCKLRQERSKAVHVDIVGIDVGTVDDKSGEMVFQSYDEDSFSLNWQNSIRWRRHTDGLRVNHLSFGTLQIALPRWFPLPDAVVKATVNAGTQWMLQDGQSKVAKAIAERWQSDSAP